MLIDYNHQNEGDEFMQTIKTERLILRPLKYSDVNDFYEYAASNDVGPLSGWEPHETRLDTLLAIKNLKLAGYVYAIEYTGKMIGTVSFPQDDKRIGMRAKMIGYSLNKDYWGMGLGTEAAKAIVDYIFASTLTDTVAGYCFPENKRSAAVLEKCGLKYEGRLNRSFVQYDKSICDLNCYLITREDYEKR